MFSAPKPTYYDIFKRRKPFLANLASVGAKFESLARNWTPLLPQFKKFFIYLTQQFAVLSDPDNPDPGWKEFSNEALSAIDRLQPILDELSKSTSHIPELFGYVEDLLKHLPQLIVYFDKLQFHIPLSEMIPHGQELQHDISHLVMSRVEANLPHYEVIKKTLEDAYLKYDEMNGFEVFSNRSYVEKITLLTALGGFNNGLKQIFLAMNMVSIQLGIRVDALLSYPIFMKKQLSIEQLCTKFNKFYKEALKETGFNLSDKKSLYPFQEEILSQQREMLAALQDVSKLQDRVDNLYMRTVTDMADVAEKHIALIEKTDADTNNYLLLMQGFLRHLQTYKKQNDLINMVKSLKQNSLRDQYKSKKNEKFIQTIETIYLEMKDAIKRMHEKERNTRLFLEIRIKRTEDKYGIAAESKPESEQKSEPELKQAIKEVDTTYAHLKDILTGIFQEFKKISETLETRPKPQQQQLAAPSEPQVEKILNLIDGQLAVMLDPNVYQQYICGRETAVKFEGEGWVVVVGAALNKVKQTYNKYKELSFYFESKKPDNISEESPRDQLLLFMVKTKEFAEVSQELVKSLVILENDPFVKSIMSSAGLKNIIYPLKPEEQVPEEQFEEEEVVEEHKIDVVPEDGVTKVLNAISKIYEKSAQKHLQDDEKTKSTVATLFRIYQLSQQYQAFKALEKNKIQVSNTQMLAFMFKHAKDLFALLQDVPANISSLMLVSKKEFSLLIEDLNSGLCELMLMLNRIELESYFKKGFFSDNLLPDLFSAGLQKTLKIDELPDVIQKTSLSYLIDDIYKKLEEFNYVFAKQYPFLDEIQSQQQKIMISTDSAALKKSYASYSIDQTKIAIGRKKAVDTLVVNENNKKQATYFNSLLDDKIQKLGAELSANKRILSILLKKLTQQDTSFETLDTKLAALSQSENYREHIYLLYQRDTKKLMAELQQQTTTRADILTDIDSEIDKLSEKRAQHYYFFAKKRRANLEETLSAYHALRQLLMRPGHKVTDFASESPEQYKLLVAHDKPLLVKLLRNSEQSYYLKNEKMIIGDVLPHPERVLTQAKILTVKIQQTSAVSARIAELRSACNTSTRHKKIKLLEALHTHLETKSLDKSLAAMQKDITTKADFYLLHEGLTGKALKEISQLTLSKKDMLQKINLEIFRLKQSRQQMFYFSEASRKRLLEERIQACLAFVKAIEDSPAHVSLRVILSNLTTKDSATLQKHDSKLLGTLQAWEETNSKFEVVSLPSKRHS